MSQPEQGQHTEQKTYLHPRSYVAITSGDQKLFQKLAEGKSRNEISRETGVEIQKVGKQIRNVQTKFDLPAHRVLPTLVSIGAVQIIPFWKPHLTPREEELIEYALTAGNDIIDDAVAALGTTRKTIKTHLSNIYGKHCVSTLSQALAQYVATNPDKLPKPDKLVVVCSGDANELDPDEIGRIDTLAYGVPNISITQTTRKQLGSLNRAKALLEGLDKGDPYIVLPERKEDKPDHATTTTGMERKAIALLYAPLDEHEYVIFDPNIDMEQQQTVEKTYADRVSTH